VDILLENIGETGAPPKARLKDAKSAHSIYTTLRESDAHADQDRSKVQAMFDGDPPYNPNTLRSMGQAYRANLNFGEAAADLENALAAYTDLVNGVEKLVEVKTTFGDESERQNWAGAISEEFHKTLVEWDQFHFNFQLLAHHFISQGLGVTFFENDKDWRWRVCGIGDFLIPRGTQATEDRIEFAVARRVYLAHELYNFIKNPKAAKEAGWNVEEVRKALATIHKGNRPADQGWEELEKEFKNNDLFYSYARAGEIRVNHYYVREYDGTVSHYIGLRDGTNTDFLYKKEGRFKKASEAFNLFTFGVGNGTYHSIRGLGYKIFPHIQVSNRLRCAMVDGSMMSTSLVLQPKTAEDVSRLSLAFAGPISFLPPNLEVVPTTFPNFNNSVMPVVQELSMTRQANTGSYRTHQQVQGSKERTATEVQAQLANESVLTTASINLFYVTWGKLLKESFKRLQKDTWQPGDAGYEGYQKFRSRLEQRGVPWKAVIDVYDVTPVRAVGYGSSGARILAFNEFIQLLPRFDEVGQQNLIRDRVAARVGYDQVDRYLPAGKLKERLPTDAKIAELENAQFQDGRPISVMPTENHSVHIRVHLADARGMLDATSQGIAKPDMALAYLTLNYQHSMMHLQQIAGDPTRKIEVGQYNEMLNLMREAIVALENNMRAQQENMRKHQEALAKRGGGQGGIDPNTASKLQDHQLAMQMKVEEAKVDQQIKLADHQQKMALRDAEIASKIRNS